jgi:hypothetical protein
MAIVVVDVLRPNGAIVPAPAAMTPGIERNR